MPQGLRKLTAKKPNDIKIKTSKDKVKKQTQRMKKGGTLFDAFYHKRLSLEFTFEPGYVIFI